MKKVLSFVLVAVMLCSVLLMASCGKEEKKFVAVDASDLLTEDFGIAVTKGNTALLNAVNAVVDKWVADGTINKYMDYYNDLGKFAEGDSTQAPDAGDLKVTWDFGEATEVITVYTESGFPPYEFLYNNEIVGLDIAIMNEVAVNMGKKVVVNDGAFDFIPTNVQTATGDAVGAAGMTINDERKEKVDFSNVYCSSTLVVVSAEDKAISSVKDLSGLKVAVQEGTSGDLIISAARTADGYSYEVENDDSSVDTVTIKVDATTEVVQYKQYSLALADLKNGRVDAILMDKLPAQLLLASAN